MRQHIGDGKNEKMVGGNGRWLCLARLLVQFAVTARDETDMDKLTAELVRVVQETMQPEQVSVWLKPTARYGASSTNEQVRSNQESA
jgi:hypothetical protein